MTLRAWWLLEWSKAMEQARRAVEAAREGRVS
jgi:hypothetical protein